MINLSWSGRARRYPIITAVAQVILNVIDFGMSAAEAVLAPRFDCQGDLVTCPHRIPEYVCAEVRRRHPIERLPQSHGVFALVHAIARGPGHRPTPRRR